MLNQKMKNTLEKYFNTIPEIMCVVLHGSILTNYLRCDSDIDIAIVTSKKITKLNLLNYASELESKLARQVDIGIISSDNLVYSKEALINGKVLYCRNGFNYSLYKTNMLAMYLNFQDERKEIVNEYKNR